MRSYHTVNVAKYFTEICDPRLMRPKPQYIIFNIRRQAII